MSEVVKGEGGTTYSTLHGFVYRYTCPECGKVHKSTAPELSVPALCHSCYSGNALELLKQRQYRKRKGERRKHEQL